MKIIQRVVRAAAVTQPGDHDPEKGRRYRAVLMTGEQVTDYHTGRMRYAHQLDITGNIRLDRANSGRMPVLDNHTMAWAPSAGPETLGIVEQGTCKLGADGLEAIIRFKPDEHLPEDIRNGLEDRVLQNLSIGANVHGMERVESEGLELARITDWEPFEVSVVPAGADSGARIIMQNIGSIHRNLFGSGGPLRDPDGGSQQTATPPDADAIRTAERERIAGIHEVCQSIGVDPAQFIESGQSVEDVRAEVRQRLGGPLRIVPADPPAASVDANAVRQGERDRIKAIREICQSPMAGGADPTPFIDGGQSPDQVRAELWNKGATVNGPDGASLRQASTPEGQSEEERRIRGIQHAFLERGDPEGLVAEHEKLKIDAGEYRGISLMDAGRLLMGRPGATLTGYGASIAQGIIQHAQAMRQWVGIPGVTPGGGFNGQDVLGAQASIRQAFGGVSGNLVGSQGSADLSVVVEDLMHRMLSAAYASEMGRHVWPQCCKVEMAKDFRPQNHVFLGAVPDFEPRGTGLDFSRGEIPNPEKATTQVVERGQTILVDRVTIINDDLGVVFNTPRLQGEAASRTQEHLFFGLLHMNSQRGPNISVSGTSRALFHADHGNLITGAAISAAAVNSMRTALSSQKLVGSDAAGQYEEGGFPMFGNFMLDTFLCSKGQESALLVIRDSEKEPGSDNQNPQKGTFKTVAASPILDDTTFFGSTGTYVYGFEKRKSPICMSFFGSQSPYMFMSEISVGRGMVWHAAIDVGCDAVNYRGAVLNPGT